MVMHCGQCDDVIVNVMVWWYVVCDVMLCDVMHDVVVVVMWWLRLVSRIRMYEEIGPGIDKLIVSLYDVLQVNDIEVQHTMFIP